MIVKAIDKHLQISDKPSRSSPYAAFSDQTIAFANVKYLDILDLCSTLQSYLRRFQLWNKKKGGQ